MVIAPVFELFAMMAMGHFVADFGLQSDRMAQEKCPGRDVTLPWQWWLASHAAIHGFVVAMLTGQAVLGVAEWWVHALIDLAKCRQRFGLRLDQSLHLFTKLLWAWLACTVLS